MLHLVFFRLGQIFNVFGTMILILPVAALMGWMGYEMVVRMNPTFLQAVFGIIFLIGGLNLLGACGYRCYKIVRKDLPFRVRIRMSRIA